MATTITKIDQTKVLSNLDTYNHTALLNSMYFVSCTVSEIPPSGITITIKQNGTTMASIAAPAASQQLTELQVILNCSMNDVISVILASASASDSIPNTFKGLLKITPGTV